MYQYPPNHGPKPKKTLEEIEKLKNSASQLNPWSHIPSPTTATSPSETPSTTSAITSPFVSDQRLQIRPSAQTSKPPTKLIGCALARAAFRHIGEDGGS